MWVHVLLDGCSSRLCHIYLVDLWVSPPIIAFVCLFLVYRHILPPIFPYFYSTNWIFLIFNSTHYTWRSTFPHRLYLTICIYSAIVVLWLCVKYKPCMCHSTDGSYCWEDIYVFGFFWQSTTEHWERLWLVWVTLISDCTQMTFITALSVWHVALDW